MNGCDERLKRVFDAKSVAITGLQGVPTSKVIDPFDEDPAFFAEFTRVIDDATLKHNDDIVDDIEILPERFRQAWKWQLREVAKVRVLPATCGEEYATKRAMPIWHPT
jgi:hypothetical protein